MNVGSEAINYNLDLKTQIYLLTFFTISFPGSNNAPFNSTQFLMNDRGSESIRYLDDKLDVKRGTASAPEDNTEDERTATRAAFATRQVSRARESSFSLDSDEDYYYSSPEDEEEFVNKEFIKDYNSVRTDRLVDMTKYVSLWISGFLGVSTLEVHT